MAQRRTRAATEEKRQRLLDATEELMLTDGYAAVSSRSVAAAVGIQAPLVHYYFPTLDDLFIAAIGRRSQQNLERLAASLRCPTLRTAAGPLGVQPGRIDGGPDHRVPRARKSSKVDSR